MSLKELMSSLVMFGINAIPGVDTMKAISGPIIATLITACIRSPIRLMVVISKKVFWFEHHEAYLKLLFTKVTSGNGHQIKGWYVRVSVKLRCFCRITFSKFIQSLFIKMIDNEDDIQWNKPTIFNCSHVTPTCMNSVVCW